jgi:hypothetical protein
VIASMAATAIAAMHAWGNLRRASLPDFSGCFLFFRELTSAN